MLISHRIACGRFIAIALPAFVLAPGCWPEMAESAEFALTRDGKPAVTIVIAAAPAPAATFGAQELQLHVQKITGATLPIMHDTEQIAGPRVLLGPSAVTSRLGLEESHFEDQEYQIRFLDDDLVMLGKEQATSYAVHDFLERFCNVRWYGPGDSQMVFPETDTLVVEPREVRRRPTFAWRTIFPWTQFMTARELYNQPSDEDLSLFWLRHRMGGEAYACNHSLEGYYDRFWMQNPENPEVFVAEHPDWFAQGYAADDLVAYGGQPPQLCYSSQGLVDQVVADARRYFDGEGTANGAEAAGRFFAMVPMDRGGRGHWCRCRDCQSQIDQQRLSENSFDSNGSASDYWFAFVNKVARELARSHPDKYISTLAYAGYSYYPRKVQPEPNVSVQMCLHTRNCWAPGMQQDELRWYQDWVNHEQNRPLYLWLYHCLPELHNVDGPPFRCFPGFHAHAVGEQFMTFARDGIRGAFIEGVSDQVDTYVTIKLLDDPSLDVDTLLEEFFTRYYGPAAEPIKRFYLCVEETYCNPANYPAEIQTNLQEDFFQTEEIAWKYLGTEERMAKLGSLMDEATRLAVGDIEQQRVALFRQAIWDHMVEGRQQYMANQPDNP